MAQLVSPTNDCNNNNTNNNNNKKQRVLFIGINLLIPILVEMVFIQGPL